MHSEPELIITEQPAPRALRFRYKCEGRSGILPGIYSSPDIKTFPSVKIINYYGRAKVVVSCVEKNGVKVFRRGTNKTEIVYFPHPHSIVGRDECNHGVCTLDINGETVTDISNIGIQCVKKNEIEVALSIREKRHLDPFKTGFSHKTPPASNKIDLACIRLCFQVYLEGPEGRLIALKPVVSDPVHDKKAWSDLKICGLSDCSAKVDERRKIILLCEKVASEDVEVRFYEEHNGVLYWEDFGKFLPVDVHKQVAIWFQTPTYRNMNIENPVTVRVQLRRRSDGAVSESLDFTFTPSGTVQNKTGTQQMVQPDRELRTAGLPPNYGNDILYPVASPELPPSISYNSFVQTNLNLHPQIHPYVPNIPHSISGTSKQAAGTFVLAYENRVPSGSNWNLQVSPRLLNSNVSPQAEIGSADRLIEVVEIACSSNNLPASNMDLQQMSTNSSEIHTSTIDTAELDKIIQTIIPEKGEMQNLSRDFNTMSFEDKS